MQLNSDFGKEPVVNTQRSAGHGLKPQSGEEVKTSAYLRKAGICQDAQREHKQDAPDLRNDSVAKNPTPGRDGGVAEIFVSFGSDLDDTKCPCWRVIKRSKVQIGSGNFNLMKRHLVVQRGAGWSCSRH